MRPDGQPPPGRHLHSPAGAGEIVTAVDGPQRGVVSRFDAVFEGHIAVAGQFGEPVEFRLVHAVGARADDDARHFGMRQRLAVQLFQTLQRGIGVGKRLEIDQVSACRAVAVAVKLDALVDLLPDAFRRGAVRGCKRPVVTERTPSFSNGSVAVGTGKTRIDREFLDPAAEHPAEIPRIGVEPPLIAPRIGHRYILFQKATSSFSFGALGTLVKNDCFVCSSIHATDLMNCDGLAPE